MADAPMIHDFALTEHHVVILDMPVTFDMAGAERSDIVPYVWNDRHPARVGVLPRKGDAVRWFEVARSTTRTPSTRTRVACGARAESGTLGGAAA